MLIHVANMLAGLIGVGIIFIGARFLWAPQAAASGFGISGRSPEVQSFHPWLSVKAVRDIASGLFILILLTHGAPHLLGWFMLAASIIPLGDAIIVLRSGGTRAAAYGIHGATALVMLAISALLISA